MRTKIIVLLSLFAFSAMDVNSEQMGIEATLREIQLKALPRISAKAIKRTPLASGAAEIAPITYLVDDAIAVNFASSVLDASIIVVNAETDEIVHYELFSSITPATILIQLSGCNAGLYYIDMTTNSTVYNGEFLL